MTLGGRAALYAAGRGGRGPGGPRYDDYGGGYGAYTGGMHMNPGARGSGAAFGYRGNPYSSDAYGGRGGYGGYGYAPAPGAMGGYYGAGGYSGYGPSVGAYGAPMGKGMDDGIGYGDYGRTGAAGYGAGAMRQGGMEPGMGMSAGGPSQMYGGMTAAGYGGYGGHPSPSMYQQSPSQQAPAASSPTQTSANRIPSETNGGYGDTSGYGAAGAAGNTATGYGNRPPQTSATTQARVDRSYRPY